MKLLLFLIVCLCSMPVCADMINPTEYDLAISLGIGFGLSMFCCISCFIVSFLLYFLVKKKVSITKVFLWLFLPCFCIVCLLTKADSDIRLKRLCYRGGISDCYLYDDYSEAGKECWKQQEAEDKACQQKYWQFKVVELFK